jgi:hypothetical protein
MNDQVPSPTGARRPLPQWQNFARERGAIPLSKRCEKFPEIRLAGDFPNSLARPLYTRLKIGAGPSGLESV